ncbi:Tat pathway signal sequence domain protein [Brevundimonas sp. R86498]|uniref:Tat pathway signal sequence domain protein n=1 Tax=Brevundimonas sp. R86498 TaxID=3093845 RepID=UPI0037C82EDA
MRLATVALAALAVLVPAGAAVAQSPTQRDRGQQQEPEQERSRPARIAPLRSVANAGPCPFVKILYDAARYVELDGGRAAAANVGYTGEIEGVTAGCAYQSDEPITVQMNILFNLGRGPRADGDQRTYRYWIAVTERNEAVLAKEYFDLPVDFDGAATASATQEQSVVIPRATPETSGGNFEVLIGFDVTPEMAEFNRTGSRFRMTAGQAAATPPAQ